MPPFPRLRALTLLLLLLGALQLIQHFPRAGAALLMAIMAASLVVNLRQAWQQNAAKLLLTIVRARRAAHQTLGAPPALRMAYIAVLAAIFATLAVAMVLDATAPLLPLWMRILVGALSLAGMLDAAQLVWRVARHAWARAQGKLLLSGIAVLSAWLASIMADHLLSTATALNPADLAYSGAMLKGLLTPLFYIQLITGSLGTAALLAYVLIMLGTLVSMALNALMPLTETMRHLWPQSPRRLTKANKAPFAHRLVFGKNRTDSPLDRWLDARPLVLAMRPLAIMAACAAPSMAFIPLLPADNGPLPLWVAQAVAALDFHAGHSCIDLPTSSRVHYLDKDEIVIATAHAGGWRFTPGSCKRT